MRQFNVRSETWCVWRVLPSSSAPQIFVEEFVEGWLCFEQVESGQRWRLPAAQAPSDWEQLSDIRLRQLLITARTANSPRVTTKTVSQQRRRHEDDARAAG